MPDIYALINFLKFIGMRIMPAEGKEKKKEKLKNITLYIPDQYDDSIKILVKYKLTPSRSEFIRIAIRDLLKEKLPHFKDLSSFNEIIASHPLVEERKRGVVINGAYY